MLCEDTYYLPEGPARESTWGHLAPPLASGFHHWSLRSHGFGVLFRFRHFLSWLGSRFFSRSLFIRLLRFYRNLVGWFLTFGPETNHSCGTLNILQYRPRLRDRFRGRLSLSLRSQVFLWSKANARPASRRGQHFAATLCRGVQTRVHHCRVGSHREALLLFFKFRAGGCAGTKRLPRRTLRQRLPAARPYQGPRATIGAASVSQSYIGTSLENYHQQARLSLVSADTMQGTD